LPIILVGVVGDLPSSLGTTDDKVSSKRDGGNVVMIQTLRREEWAILTEKELQSPSPVLKNP
jgi:hypothetical protein